MKIVYVYPQFEHLAGTERVLIDKMNYLSTLEDFEIYVVTYDQGAHPFAYPLASSVKHIDFGICFYRLYKYNYVLRFVKFLNFRRTLRNKLADFISNTKPDIVVVTTYHPYIMSLINTCPGHFVRLLESHIDKRFLHCNDPVNRKSLIKWICSFYDMEYLNRKVKQFDILVALHQNDANDWSRYIKTIVISNIVHLNDTNKYSDQQSKRVIFVGRYTIQKGIPDLFEIWKIVYQKHSDWHLDLYGDGDLAEIPYTEDYRQKINIHVHPSDPNIFFRYIESSIFVLTSLYEPFGLVLPEAMSCGLPVIAFDCPSGPAKIITDSVDGFLIKNRNVDEFAERLCQLIDSPQLRIEMGKAAIASSQRYSADLIMPQWISLFKELTATRKR